ncbi:hypothetical protein C3V38_05360 [Dietzia sp. oral taxon 368]|nr:hypothetical protein C3V38_05360 [Dietzia sp. oral taxon 368]
MGGEPAGARGAAAHRRARRRGHRHRAEPPRAPTVRRGGRGDGRADLRGARACARAPPRRAARPGPGAAGGGAAERLGGPRDGDDDELHPTPPHALADGAGPSVAAASARGAGPPGHGLRSGPRGEPIRSLHPCRPPPWWRRRGRVPCG